MSPGNQGVFQLLKEVSFRRILAFYNSRKWGHFRGALFEAQCAFGWLVRPDHWKYSLDQRVVNMIYICLDIYSLASMLCFLSFFDRGINIKQST